MEEVPRAQRSLLALDEQGALAGQDEEVLLLVLGVVAAVRLAGWKHVDADSELLELRLRRLERALRARTLLLPALRRAPHRVAHVHDEPPWPGRRQTGARLVERRLGHALPAARLEQRARVERLRRDADHRIAQAGRDAGEDLRVTEVRRRLDDRLCPQLRVARLEDARADEHAVGAELHAERRVGGGRD